MGKSLERRKRNVIFMIEKLEERSEEGRVPSNTGIQNTSESVAFVLFLRSLT